MHRPRLLHGCLPPDSTVPFLPLPDGEDSSDSGGGGSSSGSGGPTGEPAGYPPNTPVAQMAEAQQAAYWKAQARKHEDRSKQLAAWRSEHEPKVSAYDQLVETSKTEHERAVEAAKADGAAAARQEARAQMVRELVDAEFRAAAMGALTREQVAEILAPLDPSFFLDGDGKVDAAKVSTYVSKVVPAAGSGGGGNGSGSPTNGAGRTWPDTGQGRRGGDGPGKATVASGRELYQRLKQPQTTQT